MIRDEYIVDVSILDEEVERIRVDKYLSEVCEDLSRSEIKGYFDESLILVNSKIVKPSYKVVNDDLIYVLTKEAEIVDIIPEEIPLDIVYEDNDLLVISQVEWLFIQLLVTHTILW